MDFDTRDGLTLGGLALMALGVGMIFLPLAFVLLGAFSLYLGMR